MDQDQPVQMFNDDLRAIGRRLEQQRLMADLKKPEDAVLPSYKLIKI